MPKVTFVNEKNEKQEIDVPAGSNLRKEARKAGIPIHGMALSVLNPVANVLNCMGNGMCGTCRVLVKQGMENLSPRTMMEKVNLAAHPESMLVAIREKPEELRLACQVTVNGDCTIELHPSINWSGENFWQKPYPNK
jgi:ferredoxin